VPRRRLGVALLVPQPAAGEIDTLRRAVGADDVDRLPTHLTLVPPVNVREDELDDAIGRLRDAAEHARPFALRLGPPATFLPINPVLYLDVGGEVAAVDAIRNRVFRPPLERPLTWPFQPHVTLLDGGDPGRVRAAVDALAGWTVDVVIDRVHLLQEHKDDDGTRRWLPIAEEVFGGPAVVGRGGLELELAVGGALGEAATEFRDHEFAAHQHQRFGTAWTAEPLSITARRDGRIVATADGDVRPNGEAYLAKLIVSPELRSEGIGAHVVAAFASAAADRGATFVSLRADASDRAVAFYERLGFERWYELPAWRNDQDFVQLRKFL
jgi:2'-5' RNA ligase/predicted N-acetyltransferase YhbS